MINSVDRALSLTRLALGAMGMALLPLTALCDKRAAVPELTIDILSNGSAEIRFLGNPGVPYRLERSSDLRTWFSLVEEAYDSPRIAWLDDDPLRPASFYRVLPAAEPFNPANLAAAAAYSAQHGGAAVVVMQHGRIVFEIYHHGADENTATHIFSGTKAFWACALAAALEDGLIHGLDERVADTITEWNDTTLHPGKRFITVGHLASLSSGLSQNPAFLLGPNPLAEDLYHYVIHDLSLNAWPGTTFQYGPSHFYVFGVLLERKLASAGTPMNPLEYLETRVLKPLGIEYESWLHDRAGNPHLPNGCFLTPRNWIKLGSFFLQQGWSNGREILPAETMAMLRVSTGPNPGHGQFLWLNRPNGYPPGGLEAPPSGDPGGFLFPNGHPDMFGALGAGKNRMYVMPGRNAVVVRQTLQSSDDFQDEEFLNLLFGAP